MRDMIVIKAAGMSRFALMVYFAARFQDSRIDEAGVVFPKKRIACLKSAVSGAIGYAIPTEVGDPGSRWIPDFSRDLYGLHGLLGPTNLLPDYFMKVHCQACMTAR